MTSYVACKDCKFERDSAACEAVRGAQALHQDRNGCGHQTPSEKEKDHDQTQP